MFQVTSNWNPMQARLRELLGKKECFEEALQLLYTMHSLLHTASVYGTNETTYLDYIWAELQEEAFRIMLTPKDDTIAWNIWHITRIEDLTVNMLINQGRQVYDKDWGVRLNTKVTDTGNAMSDDEIINFSNEINMQELFLYRKAVGIRTKEILGTLTASDLKRKVKKDDLLRICTEGGLIDHKDSIWLLDFWGKKTVAGIILMPVTRHQLVHLNDSRDIKERYKKISNKK